MSHVGKERGILAKWGPDRGYGFVVTTSGEEVFAHASEFLDLKTAGPPEIGQHIRFDVIADKGKKRMVRAIRIRNPEGKKWKEKEK